MQARFFFSTVIFYSILTFIALVFAVHGVQGINRDEVPMIIVKVLGFSDVVNSILVFLAGALDIIVAVLLLLYPKKWILIWSGLWPWLPFLLATQANINASPIEAMLISVAIGVALLLAPSTTLAEKVIERLSK